jgi:succinate-acetate transporter protein
MNRFFELFAVNIRSILAFLVTVFSFGFLFLLLKYKVPEGNADVLNVAAGLILGVLAGVTSYYFGASKDKSDVDKADSAIEKKKAGIDV